jgi:4'-phosphopantetheinyl transferase
MSFASIYVQKITWPCSDTPLYLAQLPPIEQQQAEVYKHPHRLRSFIASRLFIRRCLSHQENSNTLWRLSKINQRLVLDKTQSSLHLSISHSGDWLACVLSSEQHCGIDIEQRPCKNNFLAIAQRFFADEEYQYLRQLPLSEAESAFLDFWTRKEACVKAWHQGLAHHLAHIRFVAHTANPISYPTQYQHLPLSVKTYATIDWQLAVALYAPEQDLSSLEIRTDAFHGN